MPRPEPIPLAELGARFVRHTEAGETRDAILCESCPVCRGTDDDHAIIIPFSDKGGRFPNGQPIWRRVSGRRTHDITLTPSYQLTSGCKLHGFVREGHWRGC